MQRRLDYKSSGVDIELGNDASRVLYEAAKLTWCNRQGRLGEVVGIFPDFSGLRAICVGGVTDAEAYNTWNMGQRMVVITPKPDEVMQIAEEHETDSQIIGEISKRPGISVRNRGLNSGSEPELVFQ